MIKIILVVFIVFTIVSLITHVNVAELHVFFGCFFVKLTTEPLIQFRHVFYFGFVLLIFVYVKLMDRLDAKYGVTEYEQEVHHS